MRITSEISDSVVTIRLVGDLDSRTAPAVQNEILARVDDGRRLLIDLTGVPYMSSAGLRTLLLVYRQAVAQEGGVALAGLAPEVRDVLSATGFLSFFVVRDSVEDAREALLGAPSATGGAA